MTTITNALSHLLSLFHITLLLEPLRAVDTALKQKLAETDRFRLLIQNQGLAKPKRPTSFH